MILGTHFEATASHLTGKARAKWANRLGDLSVTIALVRPGAVPGKLNGCAVVEVGAEEARVEFKDSPEVVVWQGILNAWVNLGASVDLAGTLLKGLREGLLAAVAWEAVDIYQGK